MFWLAIVYASLGHKVRIWCGEQDRADAEAGRRHVLGAGRAMLLCCFCIFCSAFIVNVCTQLTDSLYDLSVAFWIQMYIICVPDGSFNKSVCNRYGLSHLLESSDTPMYSTCTLAVHQQAFQVNDFFPLPLLPFFFFFTHNSSLTHTHTVSSHSACIRPRASLCSSPPSLCVVDRQAAC